MKVKDLVSELMQGDQESVVFVRAPDGSLGTLETVESEVEIEAVEGVREMWAERHDSEPTLGEDDMPVRQATVFVLDGPVA